MTKREATVNQYMADYLHGKSEEKCLEFRSKPIDRQYAIIMSWKYRRDDKKGSRRRKKASESRGLTSAEVIRHIQSLPDLINMIENLPDADFDVMYAGLDAAREALQNYHRNRKAREIAVLEQERDALQRRIDALRSDGGL
ncbi:MAG: hypothetical protein K2M31_04870 [Muribaculaceae bacterium]|nr:hypothetical protein [Muribaculaceae bacterium]